VFESSFICSHDKEWRTQFTVVRWKMAEGVRLSKAAALALELELPLVTLARNAPRQSNCVRIFICSHDKGWRTQFTVVRWKMAEGVRFELTRPFGLPVFKTGAINHSATPPGVQTVAGNRGKCATALCLIKGSCL
jgi:hypothetical protein